MLRKIDDERVFGAAVVLQLLFFRGDLCCYRIDDSKLRKKHKEKSEKAINRVPS